MEGKKRWRRRITISLKMRRESIILRCMSRKRTIREERRREGERDRSKERLKKARHKRGVTISGKVSIYKAILY